MPGVFEPLSPIGEHRTYLADRPRMRAYARALEVVVRPGAKVLDLGAGTGVLGILALRAGAEHVYAVDRSGMLQLAREIAASNGLAEHVTHVRGMSTQVRLPERVDVVVADQMSAFGLAAGLLTAFADAAKRHLRPGGVSVPSALALRVAPVEDPDGYEQVAFWSRPVEGIDLGPVQRHASNIGHLTGVLPSALLAPARDVLRVSLPDAGLATETCECAFTPTRPGLLHGVLGFFVAELAPGVTMTNAPGAAHRIDRDQLLLPIAEPVEVTPGDTIRVRLRFDVHAALLTWRVTVLDGGGRVRSEHIHSTFNGKLLTTHDVALSRPDARPVLSRWGEARRAVLDRCDGKHTLAEIASQVQHAFADIFASEADCRAFAAELVRRHGADAG